MTSQSLRRVLLACILPLCINGTLIQLASSPFSETLDSIYYNIEPHLLQNKTLFLCTKYYIIPCLKNVFYSTETHWFWYSTHWFLYLTHCFQTCVSMDTDAISRLITVLAWKPFHWYKQISTVYMLFFPPKCEGKKKIINSYLTWIRV
jgi:hypothetical protein